MMRRNGMKIAALSAALMVAATGTAAAGEWKQDEKGWWWQFEDGSYLKGRSAALDGNLDGIAESYMFGEDGYMLASTTTADGVEINEKGQSLNQDGTVQEVAVATTYATTEPGTVGGYYLGDTGFSDGNGDGVPEYEYTIYYGYAVKVIDENTISVKPDQFDNMEPMTYHKVADGVYEWKHADGVGVNRIVFEGNTLTYTNSAYGDCNVFKK